MKTTLHIEIPDEVFNVDGMSMFTEEEWGEIIRKDLMGKLANIEKAAKQYIQSLAGVTVASKIDSERERWSDAVEVLDQVIPAYAKLKEPIEVSVDQDP